MGRCSLLEPRQLLGFSWLYPFQGAQRPRRRVKCGLGIVRQILPWQGKDSSMPKTLDLVISHGGCLCPVPVTSVCSVTSQGRGSTWPWTECIKSILFVTFRVWSLILSPGLFWIGRSKPKLRAQSLRILVLLTHGLTWVFFSCQLSFTYFQQILFQMLSINCMPQLVHSVSWFRLG